LWLLISDMPYREGLGILSLSCVCAENMGKFLS
jgi:hypothetical protein